MNIGQNIKRRRKELDMTLEDVAKQIGVSRQTLSRYETGVIGNIPSDKIEALAKALKTTPAFLMGWEDAESNLVRAGLGLEDIAEEMNIPLELAQTIVTSTDLYNEEILKKVIRAAKLLAKEQLSKMISLRPLPSNVALLNQMQKIPLVGQIACGTPILAEQNIDDYIDLPGHIRADFALTCKGESMIGAGIRTGDIVYIRKQEEVENGQIAAVMVGGDEATLKRVYTKPGVVQLVAENPNIAPAVFIGEEAEQIHIIGLAVAYTHVLD